MSGRPNRIDRFGERAGMGRVELLQSRTMIWLLRHGQAADGSPDAERPLTDKGQAQSRNAGAALAAMGAERDACVASPKARAAETARLACEQFDGMEIRLDDRLAGGPFDPH